MTAPTSPPASWSGAWVARELDVALRTSASPLGLELPDLVGLALRRNPRRAHLLVSRVLGKHVPTDPRLVDASALLLGRLAGQVLGGEGLGGEVLGGRLDDGAWREAGAALRAGLAGDIGPVAALWRTLRAAPAPELPGALVLGYAETATALGSGVARALGAPYLCSTRRAVPGLEPVAGFEEEHSHATSHLLLPVDPALLAGAGPLVLVDDELSTGRTALHTIRAVHALHPRERYVVAALVDLRSEADRQHLHAEVEALGARLDVVSLVAGSVEMAPDAAARAAVLLGRLPAPARSGASELGEAAAEAAAEVALPWPDVPESGRHGLLPVERVRQEAAVAAAAQVLAAQLAGAPGAGPVLVLGTEELMEVPLELAAGLAELLPRRRVLFSTTTRSPVQPVDADGSAIRTALCFASPEDGTDRFAYNVEGSGAATVVLVTDAAAAGPGLHRPDGLLAALAGACPDVRLAVLPVHLPLPEPLRGPGFGSYAAEEVGWLLTDLSGARLEAPVEEREEAIQSGGAHYAESLPVEYVPSPDYLELFDRALEESAEQVARAVGVVTELLLAERGGDRVVLASLARAGTPVGVLVRRWARAVHGAELPHYAVSIVRGRGIDEVALRWLDREHGAERVVFLDGWTGKGAIARELTAALASVAASGGPRFDPRLAVLADPGRCVDTFGTREDFLIPSACLNSTVSGLVSRTVLNSSLLRAGQFHGAKPYPELAAADVSARFVDAVSERFADEAAEVSQTWPALAASERTPDWGGWAAVERISADYGIGDPTLVKPGVGETTRVLLRRVPWRVLVRRGAAPGLAHVLLLAEQRGVTVEEVEDVPYSCVGLIHPRYTRAATGSDGRAAAGASGARA
ncbi:RNA binding Pelota-like protein [Motilibacter peucedani]|uniref:RNA binding Pelota-like protein n=1 Tax=Motilibacter peucedani TaxID=598650 RepID=A0A420XMW5_9ACTN|nr:phosphoribosyltransferase domain-containing protein [Motilibacter peucedani]RKS72623.1 RNA binding Pelota-like protein [Motilibacter peucedani]